MLTLTHVYSQPSCLNHISCHSFCKSDNFIVHYTDNTWNPVSGITTWRLKINLKAGTDRFTVHDINNTRSLHPTRHHMNKQVSFLCIVQIAHSSTLVFSGVQKDVEIDFPKIQQILDYRLQQIK